MNDPTTPPPFTFSTVVSILISSSFLQMSTLTTLSLRYIARNLSEILALPVDLSCIGDGLCARLAKLTPAEVLVGLADGKGRLLPRLYKKRLEVDFRERAADAPPSPSPSPTTSPVATVRSLLAPSPAAVPSLVCCRNCHRLFPEGEGGAVKCEKEGGVGVGFRGELGGRMCEPVDNW